MYSCCVEPYVDITYTIVLRRKPMFFTYNLVFPCVLLMVIGILVFCLPPESGEKVSLSVTVLLAMAVDLPEQRPPPGDDRLPAAHRRDDSRHVRGHPAHRYVHSRLLGERGEGAAQHSRRWNLRKGPHTFLIFTHRPS